jgi:hypothetical protein
VIALPSVEKLFHLLVTVDKKTALGVLLKGHGGQRQTVASPSKILDSVSWGWPEWIQSVATTAFLTEDSRKLTFWGALIVSMSYRVRTILNQKVG